MNLRGTVELGSPSRIDPLAVLGEPPGRDIADHTLRIGPDAVVRAFTIVYGGSVIGRGLETGHGVVIREENRIGDDVRIWSGSVIDYGCSIGHRVRIHNHVYLAQHTVVEDDAFVGPGVRVANDRFPVCMRCFDAPVIRRRARLGVNATLLPGVEIGEESLVGAGAVVTHDVEPWAIVAGNPARVIGSVRSLRCPKDDPECMSAAAAARRLLEREVEVT